MSEEEKTSISVMLVEDDDLIRARLSGVVEDNDQLSLLASCATVSSAKSVLNQSVPDVLLVDLDLPDGNGLELIQLVNQSGHDTAIMVISVFGDENHILKAIAAGASGYLLKDDESIQIETAIIDLAAGGAPISPSIARHLMKHFRPEEQLLEKLTKREQQVLQKVAKGYTSQEIAEMEGLSYHTVATHVKNIYRKLSVNSRAEAVFEALKMNLI
ncbi:response regulator [Leucothrix pacifica]|uniref:DNA-binding response regulator n=1 Tax=Leucothrix pacifica TaxID=1247513 RepID=A0A317CHT6_9GAMM|nr:response regulator transcription factor [Leucothrix pacifica]PWQ95832.1 DNA-binding response regulator [Leucothrix pacifica]